MALWLRRIKGGTMNFDLGTAVVTSILWLLFLVLMTGADKLNWS